jgi:hypothetical protein
MSSCVGDIDILDSYARGESKYTLHLSDHQICSFPDLEPYHHVEPWTKELKGRKVLVIHPFAELIRSQYLNHRARLFDIPDILPSFELITLKAVQTLSDSIDPRFSSLFHALDWMENEAMSKTFDVAILGCGAYGLPLAVRLKRHGKVAVHLGGATQILFGIKGRRWDQIDFFRSLSNEYWTRPSKSDLMPNASKVEDKCYW